MTRDDIIRMAQDAFKLSKETLEILRTDSIERFAALVAAHEREACTAICRDVESEEIGDAYRCIARECEDRIRARGEK